MDVPPNMVGFRASGVVTKEDFTGVVMPAVNRITRATGELNYLLVLDTPIRNFTMGAWFKDAVMGMRHLLKWKRAAIVSDSEGVKYFTALFSVVMPGEFRCYEHVELVEAIEWVSGGRANATLAMLAPKENEVRLC